MDNGIYQAVPLPGLVADLILVLHAAIVAFVLIVQILILIGGLRDWKWVRHLWLRVLHLGTIGFVTLQAWLGQLCPLTVWEHELRRAAGQEVTETGFVEYWVGQVIYFDLPPWIFVTAYTAFTGLVVFSWWWIPPVRRGRTGN